MSIGRTQGWKAVALAAVFLAGNVVAADAADPKRGGIARIAVAVNPGALDPMWGDAPTSDRAAYNLLFETLLVVTKDGFQPKLATKWVLGDDKKTLTFTLRKGVKFHDGTPFDAKAVKYNLDRTRGGKGYNSSSLAPIASVEVVDDDTVTVRLAAPSGAILSSLGSESGMMVSPKAAEELGEKLKRNPVGTGPFRFKSWDADTITVERFPDYWEMGKDGKPLPYLDGAVLRQIANAAVKIVEVQSGNVDLTDAIQTRDFDKIERDANLTLVDNPQYIHQWVAFNVRQPPFDNKDLRLAVEYGLNRDAMSKIVAGKYGLVTPALIPPQWWIYDGALAGYGYDPEKARAFLKKSGFTGKVSMAVIKRDPDTQVAQIIQSQLKAIGLEVDIEMIERQAWMDLVVKKKAHEMAMLRVNVPRLDPDHLFGATFGRDAGANWSGAQDEALFTAIDKGLSSYDPAERKPYYVEAQKILLDNAYYAFLFHRAERDVQAKRLQDVEYEPVGPFILTRAWFSK
jgi:peptide/nickel transport system substrate-binding protein